MMEHDCDYCGAEDGRFRYGPVGSEEAIGEACLALVLRDIEDQRQALIFEERWRTIQRAPSDSWAVHMFHGIPAPWCALCQSEVRA